MVKKNIEAREKYLEKVNKLLRLAKSASSPHEAASAIAKAQAFMKEYGLTEQEVSFSSINQASSKSALSNAKSIPSYLGGLVNVICKAFGVDGYFEWSRDAKRTVTFYGPEAREKIAAYAFDVLARQLKAARKEYQDKYCKRCKKTTKIARGDRFCEGWVAGAATAVEAFAMTSEETDQLTAYSIWIKAELGMVDSDLREAKEVNGADNAGHLGWHAGRDVNLNHGVSATFDDSYYIEGQL